MPKLIEYITVGFCSGYGDGDYRISCAVENMSKDEFNDLKLAALNAIHCAEDMWRHAQGNGKNSATNTKVEGYEMGAEVPFNVRVLRAIEDIVTVSAVTETEAMERATKLAGVIRPLRIEQTENENHGA